jgi:hypothetical protein
MYDSIMDAVDKNKIEAEQQLLKQKAEINKAVEEKKQNAEKQKQATQQVRTGIRFGANSQDFPNSPNFGSRQRGSEPANVSPTVLAACKQISNRDNNYCDEDASFDQEKSRLYDE